MSKQICLWLSLFFLFVSVDAFAQTKTWGSNFNGQIGDGTSGSANNRPTPTTIAGLTDVIAVGGGSSHSLVLKSDGTVWVWGRNRSGQLGNGTSGNNIFQLTPLQNTNISGVAQIAAGDLHNVALKSDGTVWAWGKNDFGQIGNGTFSATGAGCDCVTTPAQTSISGVTDIRSDHVFHTLARKKDGSIWAWSYNFDGEIGNGTTNSTTPFGVITPVQSSVGTGNVIFDTGRQHSLLSVPSVPTAVGANVVVRLGEAIVTFGNVTTGGSTTITAVDPNAIGAPPPTGFVIQSNTQAYDISTTAVFSGSATVCIKFPTIFDQIQFNSLRLLHGEGGVLVDRTTTRNYQTREICGSVSSLSPFVIAQNNLPTAASVSVGGRVFSGKGRGVANARVTLTNAAGQIRTATTNPFGYYLFTEVAAGETYIFSVTHKRFHFAAQVVSVTEELTELNFTAEL